jgi:hypothetical protein
MVLKVAVLKDAAAPSAAVWSLADVAWVITCSGSGVGVAALV